MTIPKWIPPETIERVKQIDLLTYLLECEPDALLRRDTGEYCLREHDSLKISNGLWHWHSRGIGGRSALDFLIHVRGHGFKEAVMLLCDKKLPVVSDLVDVRKAIRRHNMVKKPFSLPSPHSNNDRVISYLHDRGIAAEIIYACISRGILYEDTRHNAVFVGMDADARARYAMQRGTLGVNFKREVPGSNKKYAFLLAAQKPGMPLFVTESAIDALSIATLCKNESRNWQSADILSLGGIGAKNKLPVALEHFLAHHPKPARIQLYLDNDAAGRETAVCIADMLKTHHDVAFTPPPSGKDYNEYIMGRSLQEQAALSR